jgi:hypothetical protein
VSKYGHSVCIRVIISDSLLELSPSFAPWPQLTLLAYVVTHLTMKTSARKSKQNVSNESEYYNEESESTSNQPSRTSKKSRSEGISATNVLDSKRRRTKSQKMVEAGLLSILI